MEARIRVDGELLEIIEVNNGLRQGCTMAPTSYAGVVAEKWTEAVQDVEDAGVELLYKLYQQLFMRSTRDASEVTGDKGEFVDDVVLVASTREAAQAVLGRAYIGITRALGLTVSLNKTKFMVVGCGVTDEDRLPLPLDDGGTVEYVSQFPYLGSLIAESGRSHEEVDKRIASVNVSKAFWGIEKSCFQGLQFVSEDQEECV